MTLAREQLYEDSLASKPVNCWKTAGSPDLNLIVECLCYYIIGVTNTNQMHIFTNRHWRVLDEDNSKHVASILNVYAR